MQKSTREVSSLQEKKIAKALGGRRTSNSGATDFDKGIYIILNNINKVFYLGSSMHLNMRRHSHFHNLRNNKHPNPHLQKAYNKYGEDAFSFIKIECFKDCSETELRLKEQQYLNIIFDKYIIYNILKDVNFGKAVASIDPEIDRLRRIKLSIAGKGRTLSDETKQKISAAHIGLKYSDEVRAKLSQIKTGSKHSIKTKLHLSELRKGYKNANSKLSEKDAWIIYNKIQQGYTYKDFINDYHLDKNIYYKIKRKEYWIFNND